MYFDTLDILIYYVPWTSNFISPQTSTIVSPGTSTLVSSSSSPGMPVAVSPAGAFSPYQQNYNPHYPAPRHSSGLLEFPGSSQLYHVPYDSRRDIDEFSDIGSNYGSNYSRSTVDPGYIVCLTWEVHMYDTDLILFHYRI